MHIRARMIAVALAAAMSSVAALPAMAEDPAAGTADLSGTYDVKGQDAQGLVHYEGQVAVIKIGDTYRVAWSMEDHRALGTGLLHENIFAVTYMAEGIPIPGLAVFNLGADGELNGEFTLLGASIAGIETWTPVRRSSTAP